MHDNDDVRDHPRVATHTEIVLRKDGREGENDSETPGKDIGKNFFC